ncbi:hypothetical protein KKC97_10190 [bacterium]|nr:hypothetical protein [bacterium]
MRLRLLLLFSLCLLTDASAQDFQVTGATLQMNGYVAADNSCFPPCALPTPTEDSYTTNTYVPAGLGYDFGVSRSRAVTEPGDPFCCGTQDTWAKSRCFGMSAIDGDNTDFITIYYGISGYNIAGNDNTFACRATDTLTFNIVLDITNGPNGFPVIVNYSWDHFAGIGGAHDDPSMEDFCTTQAQLTVDSDGEVLQNRFDFDSPPIGVWGFNRKQNQSGSFNRFIGDQLVISGSFMLDVNTISPDPGGQTLDDQSGSQWGQIRLSLGTPIVPVPPDSLYASWLEFSLDIGSDAEMSDPTPEGNEVFDPGDSYAWNVPLPIGGLDGIENDEDMFGLDPFPVAPDGPPPATGAPVGSGLNIADVAPFWFDLDGIDHLDFDLLSFGYGPGDPPIGYFISPCIFSANNLYISYDDDEAPLYTFATTAPVTGSSELVHSIYGTTARQDEVIGLSVFTNLIPAHVYFEYPYLAEDMLHPALFPNPDPFDNTFDDDTDALDIRDGACAVYYFSVDHEAHFGLNPGSVFKDLGGGNYIEAINAQTHLGLPLDTDVDAFEFAWIPDLTILIPGPPVLALLFSVDDDDPATPLPMDESGGLDPAMIYASYLDGAHFAFLEANSLVDDVDAITAWSSPLYAGYVSPITPCDPVNDLVIAVDTQSEIVTLTFSAPQDGMYTIYQTTNPNAAAPPDLAWISLVDIPLVAGEVTNYSISYGPLPPYLNYNVIATCP